MATKSVNKGIDIDALRIAKTPRSAREVADKKLRAELRGDSGSKKTGEARDEDLAEYYRKRNQDKLDQAKLAKQKILLENPTQSLIDCACSGVARMDDLKFLIGKGVDLDDTIDDRSPLMAAAQYGSQVGVETLVRSGADVDLVSGEFGVTALMCAVNAGHLPIVTFLLDHSGANPAIVDKQGYSALQRAYERGHTVIASKLVKALSLPPPKITTVAREKIAEARKKAQENALKAVQDKKALLEQTIREVKEEEEEEKAARSNRSQRQQEVEPEEEEEDD